MRCEDARLLLFEYVDRSLDNNSHEQFTEHLERCARCRSDLESLNSLSLQAQVWHDLPAPPWQAPAVGGRIDWSSIQQWFPSLASALALILVAGLYLQQPSTPQATGPVNAAQPLPSAGAMTMPVSSSVDALMTSNRLERQQELQALVALLTAEMDRRNEETEESLRYVIAHQIQGQREIDDLYQYIRKVSLENAAAGEQM